MNTENVWKSGLQAAKLLSGSRLQIVFLLEKRADVRKQLAGCMDEDEQGVAAELCVLLSVWCPQRAWRRSRGKRGHGCNRCVRRRKAGRIGRPVGYRYLRMFQERAHRTGDVRFHLTELGEELLPLCRELERFGRLYEAAKDLVPELMGGNDIPWAESDGTAAGSTDAGSPQNTEDDFNNLPAKKASAKDRHGFYQADNAFVFSIRTVNLKTGIFYGETAGEMTELYLITDPEYQLFWRH